MRENRAVVQDYRISTRVISYFLFCGFDDPDTEKMSATTGTILTVITGPPCFGLPSCDLESTAVEALLRFGGVQHVAVHAAADVAPRVRTAVMRSRAAVEVAAGRPFPVPIVHEALLQAVAAAASGSSSAASAVPAAIASTTAAASGDVAFWAPHEAADNAASAARLDDGLSDADSAAAHAVTALVRRQLFPALEFLWLACDADAAAVAAAWAGAGAAGPAGLWARLVRGGGAGAGAGCWDRVTRMDWLRLAAGFGDSAGAFAVLERGFAAIEALLAAAARQHPATAPAYLLLSRGAGSGPSSADAYVFAAAAAVVYGRFADSSLLRAFQRQALGGERDVPHTAVRLPHCKAYAQAVASNAYLRPGGVGGGGMRFVNVANFGRRGGDSKGDDDVDPFADGRGTAIAVAACSCVAFALAANWEVVEAIAAIVASKINPEGFPKEGEFVMSSLAEQR